MNYLFRGHSKTNVQVILASDDTRLLMRLYYWYIRPVALSGLDHKVTTFFCTYDGNAYPGSHKIANFCKVHLKLDITSTDLRALGDTEATKLFKKGKSIVL